MRTVLRVTGTASARGPATDPLTGRVYVTNIGSPFERQRKEYKTPAEAKQWCRAKLAEHKELTDRYNVDMATELAEVSKTIRQLNILTMPVNQKHSWEIVDNRSNSGFTMVVELWVEQR